MKRGLAIVAGLSIGHALIALLFWALVNVPESTVWMLGLSALIAVTLIVLAGWIQASAALAWIPGVRPRTILRRALNGIPAFVVALVVCATLWWGLGRVDAWLEARAGEIDAWLIARTGWTQTGWIHRVIDLVMAFFRYVLAISIGLALVAAGAREGWRALAGTSWMRRAVGRAQIGITGIAFVLLIALPLQAVYWRPASLPPTSLELAFIVAKLSVIFLLVNAGWALALWGAMRQT